MAHRDGRERRHGYLPLGQGSRKRFVVIAIGVLLSVGTLVAILHLPGSAAQQQLTAPSAGNPARLGVTGALPGDPLREAIGAVANAITTGPPGIAAASPISTTPPPFAGITRPTIPAAQPAPTQVPHLAAAPPPATIAPQEIPSQDAHVAAAARQIGIVVTSHLPDGPLGIPGVMLGAYQRAARLLAASQPGCQLSWSVLAGIGRIESGHASGGRVDATGNTLGSILGLRLDGSPGIAAIPDTDHGMLDGDTVWDRAVGPMQFIPSSWRQWGVGNPNNIYDSTLAAGRYLCAGGINLSDPAQLQAAVYRYNHSASYVAVVLQWAKGYLTGVIPQPSAPGPVPPGTNGNGGRPVVIGPAQVAAAAPTSATRPTPSPATPSPTVSPSPSPTPSTAGPAPTPTAPTPSPLPGPAIPRASSPSSSAASYSTTSCAPHAAAAMATCPPSDPSSRSPAPDPVTGNSAIPQNRAAAHSLRVRPCRGSRTPRLC
jgi:membrane-bound lytic murein transglycosylase B